MDYLIIHEYSITIIYSAYMHYSITGAYRLRSR